MAGEIAGKPGRQRERRFFAWPTTRRGRLAVRAFASSVALCVLLIGMTILHFTVVEGEGDGAPPVWLFVPMLAAGGLAALSAIAGGVLSVRAIRDGDRSFVLFLPTGAAAIALFFILGEVLVPH